MRGGGRSVETVAVPVAVRDVGTRGEERNAGEDLGAGGFVPEHELALGVVELAGLAQHVVRYRELADVVHERVLFELGEGAALEAELLAHVAGEAHDPLRMPAGVGVLGFNRGDQPVECLVLTLDKRAV